MNRKVAKVENRPGEWLILEDGKKVGEITKGKKDFRVWISVPGGFAVYRNTLDEAKEAALRMKTSNPGQADLFGRPKVATEEKPRKKRGPVLYFAYGANTNVESMDHRCPTAEPIGKAVLKGWSFQFRGCADIVKDPDGKVEGAVWLIYPDDEDSLDRYEGYPHSYTKVTVRVEDEGGTSLEAMVYVMTERRRDGKYLPSEVYYRMLETGYRDFGMDVEQIRKAVREAAAENAERLIRSN